MPGHPNATAAAVGGALGVLVVWIIELLGPSVDPEVAGAITTLCAALVLFVGRRRGV